MASGDEPVSLEQLKQYPVMTSWFAPGLLAKLLKRVVVSEMFGQYADRRLLVAALDPVKDEELTLRARQFFPGTPFADESQRPPTVFTPDQDGAIWIDFVADLGDGFDSTFAVASLLARDKLTADGHTLPRGQLLVMGGDEVYPNADPKFYHEQLINPYAWAWPDLSPKSLAGPPVYAIPGNHDWYDGLVLFLAYFTRKWPHTHLGSWRTWQRRSYFALQLTKTVWIWGMDAQLADDVDQPQKDYFDTIAKSMEPHSKIILCGPEPGWLYTLQNGNNINKMRELCRVERKVPDSGCDHRVAIGPAVSLGMPSGLSLTAESTSPQDALKVKLQRQRRNSGHTSQLNTSPRDESKT